MSDTKISETLQDAVMGEIEQWFDVKNVDLCAATDSIIAVFKNHFQREPIAWCLRESDGTFLDMIFKHQERLDPEDTDIQWVPIYSPEKDNV